MICRFLFFLLWVSSALASGTTIGNGGVGVYCLQAVSKMARLEILDFWEAAILNEIGPVRGVPEASYLEIARDRVAAMKNQTSADYDTIVGIFDDVAKNWSFLPQGAHLSLTRDIDTILEAPEDCRFVQVVNFGNDDRVYVDSDYWNILDETSKAGLVVHEVIYKYLRYTAMPEEGSSLRTRNFVAKLFAQNKFEKPVVWWNQHDVLECHTIGDINYTAFIVGKFDHGVEIDFEYILGHRTLDRAYISSYMVTNLEDFNNGPIVGRIVSQVDSNFQVILGYTPVTAVRKIEIKDLRLNQVSKLDFTCISR